MFQDLFMRFTPSPSSYPLSLCLSISGWSCRQLPDVRGTLQREHMDANHFGFGVLVTQFGRYSSALIRTGGFRFVLP